MTDSTAARRSFRFYSTIRVEKKIDPWMTVRRGIYKTPDAYLAALKGHCFNAGNFVSQIVSKVRISEEEVDIDLFRLTVAELTDTKKWVVLDKIFDQIIRLGGALVPDEAPLALCLRYRPFYGESMIFATEPLVEDERKSNRYVLEVKHSSEGACLSTYRYDSDIKLPSEANIVFCLPPIKII